MAIAQAVAGARILISDLNAYYSLLKGSVGETVTLIYNAAGALKFQPSSDPAAGTEMFQIVNNAGTRQISLTSDGKIKFADATTLSTAPTATTVNYVTTPHIFDDFLSGALTTNAFGLNWAVAGTNGAVAAVASTAGHPGVVQPSTTGTAGSSIVMASAAANKDALLPAEFFDMTWVIQPISAIDTNMIWRFGLGSLSVPNANGTTLPTDGIWVEKASADTSYFGVCRNGGTQTRTAALGTCTNGTWAKLRVRRVDASTIGFTFNAASEVLVTTNIPTAALLFFAFMCNNGAAVNIGFWVDLFDCTISSLTR